MEEKPQATRLRIKRGVALLLTFAAGSVDIIGFLTLYHTFTAHMTGTTVHMGQDLLNREWSDTAKAGCVIGAFLFGSVIGRTMIEVGARRQVRSIASATLITEVLLMAAVVPLDAPSRRAPALVLLAMLAAAMGLQTVTLTRMGSLTIHTTFVTGMLNKFAQLVSHAVFLTYDKRHGREISAHRREVLQRACFMGAIWLLYLAGAVAGTWMNANWGIRSLLIPAGVVAIAIIADQAMPLSIEEEREEPER